MLLNVSGSQGQGKSTILNDLAERGFEIVPNKTARSILKKWDVSLEDVYESKQLTIAFQEEILVEHDKLCTAYAAAPGVQFIERSYADIFVYALAILGPFNKYSTWLEEYYEKCKERQRMFAGTFYITGRQMDIASDGVRSTNKFFGEVVDHCIKKYSKDFATYHGTLFFEVDTPDHSIRMNNILGSTDLYFR